MPAGSFLGEIPGKGAGAPSDIHRLDAWAAWTNGPVAFGACLSAAGFAPLPEREQAIPFDLQLNLSGDAKGLSLSNLVVTAQTSSVIVAHGFLPVTLNPGAPTNLVALAMEQPLRLSVATDPQAPFWSTLSNWTGITLRKPDLKVDVSGTWQAPQGKVTLNAQQVLLPRINLTLLSLEDLRVRLNLERERAQLTEGEVRVQGQLMKLTGELPLGRDFWTGLEQRKMPDWDQLRARLDITNAQLAGFEPLLPQVLAPQGTLTLQVAISPGAELHGSLSIHDARTRPLGASGALRDINLQARLEGHALDLEDATATVGGANIILTGHANLGDGEWFNGELPPFELTLSGTNVPLSRQPESIIRSDLLLAITRTNHAPPVVSGIARLRDSFYLSDLTALIPGKVATPSQRPPYFSIETAGLADWGLAVRVVGTRFLEVRSSLFNGEVSADLQLHGTLKDPIALGGLKIDSGVVRFPFGSLQVQQGLVNFSSEDPYRPKLFVTALSKQYGYDIHMEITGPVDAPILQFTSTPPLNSEQILLMLTAGEMPKGQFTLTTQQKAQTAAVFLGRDLLSKLGFGDQAEQRLTIRSGEEISDQGRPTYHVEFKLSDDWAIEGEYDRFGDFNAGFKWRIYSK